MENILRELSVILLSNRLAAKSLLLGLKLEQPSKILDSTLLRQGSANAEGGNFI